MSGLARYVSRKVATTIAVFAVFALFAAGVAVFAVAGGRSDAGSVGLSASLSDPTALEAALDDPGSAVGGSAADASTGTDARAGGYDGSGWQQLRADLRAARALQGDARRSALAAIRTKAQDGAYGEAIQRRADRHQIGHQLLFSLLPDNLQSDLTALKNAPADQRQQLRKQIVDKALAGDYGPEVQKAAQQLQALRHQTG